MPILSVKERREPTTTLVEQKKDDDLAKQSWTGAYFREFIPIGGGSGRTAPVRVSQEFGESFTPSIIDPNDPSFQVGFPFVVYDEWAKPFQPANIAGNRPNPIPLFPKTQQAGTPHEVDLDVWKGKWNRSFSRQSISLSSINTRTRNRSGMIRFGLSSNFSDYNFQFIGILHNPIGAARPNVPRTLGRENVGVSGFG